MVKEELVAQYRAFERRQYGDFITLNRPLPIAGSCAHTTYVPSRLLAHNSMSGATD